MDIKVYRFINSHAMTQIIFLFKKMKNKIIQNIFTGTNYQLALGIKIPLKQPFL